MRSFKNYFMLFLKGTGMGASDVVPGVSGGTIAFITGIYEELINSIKSFDLKAISLLFTFRLKEFVEKVNLWFLTAVFSGVLLSIFSLSHLLEYLLINHPALIWSFFFGLVVASAIMIISDIRKWSFGVVLSIVLGAAIAYIITSFSPVHTTTAYWFIFLSGAIAICAMILPGISGSFILLLLGKYAFILNAVNELKIGILLIFASGAAVGLILFSNFLSWLLKKYHYLTIGLLAGFMIGSLNKIWPWKNTISTYTDSSGVEHPLVQKNIFPEISMSSDFLPALILALTGFFLIIVLYKVSQKEDAGKVYEN
jgi:putative membrane protein